ncbi:MAG: nucleotidyltransferase domain-containing protein [Kiritimatiellae bacterium]|jgi:predicted nucleotidyltransferase|nr:nucleotidyltransferase domain-containing protein [Kiritimatiellia bacterium]
MKPRKHQNIGLTPSRSRAAIDPVAGRVVSRIADEVRPDRIYLFGSRASGTAGPESDVDVLLVYSGSENSRDIQLKTHRLFQNPVIPLDVVVLSPDEFESQKRVANTLAREVSETGILCHG